MSNERPYDYLPHMYQKRRTEAELNAYFQGISDGFYAYSWMKDGETFVGTCGEKLAEAQKKLQRARAQFPRHLVGEGPRS